MMQMIGLSRIGWMGVAAGALSVTPLLPAENGDGAPGCCPWQELVSCTPSARTAPAVTYDATRQRLVQIGGSGMFGPSLVYFNDLWIYDCSGSTWTQLPTGPPEPVGRDRTRLVHDPVRDVYLLAGGRGGSTSYFPDTWEFDPDTMTWSERDDNSIVPRRAHGMVYHDALEAVALFGGQTAGGVDDTLFYWDDPSSSWIGIKTTGDAPAARYAHAMSYDPIRQRIVVFGGIDGSGDFLGDTWEFDHTTSTWTNVSSTGPIARGETDMTYDTDLGACLMYSGRNADGVISDSWAWDGTAWREVTRCPEGRFGHAIAHASCGVGTVVVAGEHPIDGLLCDTMAFDPDAGTDGDFNHDCMVDTQDLLLLLAAWGPSSGAMEDINGDGAVDVQDLLTLLANWG